MYDEFPAGGSGIHEVRNYRVVIPARALSSSMAAAAAATCGKKDRVE